MVLLELVHDPIDKAHVNHILTRWHLVEYKNRVAPRICIDMWFVFMLTMEMPS